MWRLHPHYSVSRCRSGCLDGSDAGGLVDLGFVPGPACGGTWGSR